MNTTPHSAMLRESWREWLSNDQARAGPPGMHLVWTFLFCAVLALGFTVLGFVANARSLADWADLVRWGYWYKMNLGVCVIVGYLIHALFAASAALLGHPRLSRLRGWQRTLYYLGIPVLGVSVG